MIDERVTQLSERQRDCLRLYYARLNAKEIGRRLQISPATVKYHLTNARSILGVGSTAEAARLTFGERPPADYPNEIVTPEAVAAEPLEPDQEGQRREGLDAPLPFPTRRRPTNDLSAPTRLIQAALIAIVSLVLALLAAALLQSFNQIFASH